MDGFEEYKDNPSFKPYAAQMQALTDMARRQEQMENEKARSNKESQMMSSVGSIAGVMSKPNITASEIMAKQQPKDISQNIMRAYQEPAQMRNQEVQDRQSDLMNKYKIESERSNVLGNYLQAKKLEGEKDFDKKYKLKMLELKEKELGSKYSESKRRFSERKEILSRKLTPGQKKVDETFAKDWADFSAGGGFADVQKSLSQLKEVSVALGKSDNLTGGFIGAVPDFARKRIAPESSSTQQMVEEVVQRNLRLVLGAQFTQKEGERLIARAYDPSLDEAENKKRVDRLMKQISNAASARMEAGKYFDENSGSLKGYKGRIYSKSDFSPGNLSSKTSNIPAPSSQPLSIPGLSNANAGGDIPMQRQVSDMSDDEVNQEYLKMFGRP